MTGYQSKRAMAQDKLVVTDIDGHVVRDARKPKNAQPAQEPVAYDKTEMNGFVQDLYDKKMQEGKHGHYETMFHVVHQAIKRATPPQRPWVDLTEKQIEVIEEIAITKQWAIRMTIAQLKECNA